MTLSIAQRLRAAFIALSAIVFAVAGMGYWGMSLIRDENVAITRDWLPSVALVNQMNTNAGDFRIAEFRHVLNTDDALMAGVEKVMATVLAQFAANDAAYAALISSDEERKLYDSFKQEWAAYLAVHEKVLVLSRQNINDQAKALLEGDALRLYDTSSATLDELVELNRRGAGAAAEKSEQAFTTARTALALAAVLAVALAATASWWLIRSITRPLDRAVQVADRVATGNLGTPIEPGARDETGHLLDALARMQASLVATVGAVRKSSESIATGSSQIAAGNAELGHRTETQAASLQQTAASMAQLTDAVRGNAESARNAAQIASEASVTARDGGAAVREAVSTMEAISDSSRRIVDIIGVIDGIAFQTNILALNAAVEAARAGEQGRGFAVVASEVRMLAQRSASAAGEIKTLINDSATKVEDGTRRIGAAGETMSGLVRQVERVNEMIVQIGRATQEQDEGITQVGQAVTQLDEVTQCNAGLVEESAAATASLSQQAVQLVEAVRFFDLGGSKGQG